MCDIQRLSIYSIQHLPINIEINKYIPINVQYSIFMESHTLWLVASRVGHIRSHLVDHDHDYCSIRAAHSHGSWHMHHEALDPNQRHTCF
jgi:hypothetical protein